MCTKRGYWMSSLYFVPGKGIGSSWPTWVSWRMGRNLTADSRSLSLARKRSVLNGTVTWDFLAPQFVHLFKKNIIRSQMSSNDVWIFVFCLLWEQCYNKFYCLRQTFKINVKRWNDAKDRSYTKKFVDTFQNTFDVFSSVLWESDITVYKKYKNDLSKS